MTACHNRCHPKKITAACYGSYYFEMLFVETAVTSFMVTAIPGKFVAAEIIYMCSRGPGISTGLQRAACLTFPHGVYTSPWFSSRSFFLSDPMYRIRRQPPIWRQAANATALSWGTADTASISFHGLTALFLYWGWFFFNSAIFLILQCQVLYPPSFSFGCIVVSSRDVFHWTLKCFITTEEQLLPPRARTRFSCMGVLTHKQSTCRDGSWCNCLWESFSTGKAWFDATVYQFHVVSSELEVEREH